MVFVLDKDPVFFSEIKPGKRFQVEPWFRWSRGSAKGAAGDRSGASGLAYRQAVITISEPRPFTGN
jgi:hypothetical protein